MFLTRLGAHQPPLDLLQMVDVVCQGALRVLGRPRMHRDPSGARVGPSQQTRQSFGKKKCCTTI